jgi:hypothetical protein
MKILKDVSHFLEKMNSFTEDGLKQIKAPAAFCLNNKDTQ